MKEPLPPFANNPGLPIFCLLDEYGDVCAITQDPEYAVGRFDVVQSAWLAVDQCRKTEPHAPHTWGGEGWSEYRCKGVE